MKIFNKKKYWVKYAGNWNQINPPISYFLQRFWLKYIVNRAQVTVNGKWDNQRKHINSFENPCISKEELIEAKKVKKTKVFSDKVEICFVGAFEKGKGIHLLIDALKLTKQYSMIGKIYLVGDGTEKEKVKISIKKLNQFKIDITGPISREKLNEIYGRCHIIILPSKSEGFPKVIAEGISYGCVPIVTNVGSISHYVNKNNGVLLKTRSQDELKNAIEYLLSDRTKLKILSENGSKISKLFTFEYYNQQLIKNILNSK